MRVSTILRTTAAAALLVAALQPAMAAQVNTDPVTTTERMHEILARPGVLATLQANATARPGDSAVRLKDWERRLLEAYWRFQEGLTTDPSLLADPIATGSINP